MSILDLFKAAKSHEELRKKNADRHRPIGSVAYRDGKKVLWAGQRYLYQSPEMFKQLKDQGEFRMGHIALSQAGQSLASATPTPIKEAIKGGLTHMVTSFQKRHAENLELDRKAVEEGRMSPEKFQKYQENAQVVPKLAKKVDQGFEAISKATNTSRIISDTAVEALLTGGAAAVVKQGSRLAIKKAARQTLNQARQLTIRPQVTTVTRQGRGAGIPNRFLQLKQTAEAAQRAKQSGSANLSNIVDLKDRSLTYLDNVISDSKQSLDQIARGQIKGTKSDVRSLAAAVTGASRAQGFVRVMGAKTDALDLLNDPQTLVSGLATRQRTLTRQPEGVGVIGHHIGMVKTFELPYLQMDLKKGLEVNKILGDKHNILLGQESSNLQNMYSQLIHNTVAHAGSTKDIHIRTAFSKIDWENLTPEEAADAIAKQYWVAEQQAWKAGVHPVNVEAGWSIYNALPLSIKKRLPRGFNPLDPKDNTEAYDQYRLLVNSLNPKIKQDLLKATAEAENLLLSTYK